MSLEFGVGDRVRVRLLSQSDMDLELLLFEHGHDYAIEGNESVQSLVDKGVELVGEVIILDCLRSMDSECAPYCVVIAGHRYWLTRGHLTAMLSTSGKMSDVGGFG